MCITNGIGCITYLKLLIQKGIISYEGTNFTETQQFWLQSLKERKEQANFNGK